MSELSLQNQREFLRRSQSQLKAGHQALVDKLQRIPQNDPEYQTLQVQANSYLRDLESVEAMLRKIEDDPLDERGTLFELERGDDRLRGYAGIPMRSFNPLDYAYLKERVTHLEKRVDEIERHFPRWRGYNSGGSTPQTELLITILLIALGISFMVIVYQIGGG